MGFKPCPLFCKYGGGHKKDPSAVLTLANTPVLAEAWRERARKLAA